MRIRIGHGSWASRARLTLLGTIFLLFLISAGFLTHYDARFVRMIEARLGGQPLPHASRIYAAPRRIFVGEAFSADELVTYLQRADYTDSEAPRAVGRYVMASSSIEIRPSADSYFAGTNALRVEFADGQISLIQSLDDGAKLLTAEIEPELLTSLFDSSRDKRRLVQFDDLPRFLVEAVLSAEDKRFFKHPGLDHLRVLAAAWVDLRRGAKAQGASTITMQVARSLFFSTQRTWRRKLAETLTALELERRFTKQQIFELYANEIYLGNLGSFAIHGFGEGAQAYFGKDVREVNLAEAAFLAGILRAPNRYSPVDSNPERAVQVRDHILSQMVKNNFIAAEEAEAAKKTRLRLVTSTVESSALPYFVDIVKDHLLDHNSENELLSEQYRIYTTLDPKLERAASQAVAIGAENLDAQLARRYGRWGEQGEKVPPAQVALVALDPRTGEIKALVGGRNYGQSQLNRVLARRLPGSAFKPFVYAAAFKNAVDGVAPVVTPATTVVDEPTTFTFNGERYTPNNYDGRFHGTVTLREALTHSLNVATVKLAELVGYGRVVQVVRQLGLDPHIQATPAMALGAYEMTPLDVAAGYTVFANGGTRAEPLFIRSVVNADGKTLEQNTPRLRQVLDPRVAYIVRDLLRDVINRGTGAGVRARGFTAPAAGKTGSSHDGWFVGFTSDLLCVVWVGFDDYRELGLTGSASALPIWVEFAKRAISLPRYQSTPALVPPDPPDGITEVTIDPETLQLARPSCPVKRREIFVAGTEPTKFCAWHSRPMMTQVPVASWLSRLSEAQNAATAGTPQHAEVPSQNQASVSATKHEDGKKKGVFVRMLSLFEPGNKDPMRRK